MRDFVKEKDPFFLKKIKWYLEDLLVIIYTSKIASPPNLITSLRSKAEDEFFFCGFLAHVQYCCRDGKMESTFIFYT